MKFKGGVEISPIVLLSNANSPVDYFEIDFEKVVPFLCECTNERAGIFIEDIDYMKIMTYGIKWRSVEIYDMYLFFSYVFLIGLVKVHDLVYYWSSNIFCSSPKLFSAKI